MTEIKIAPSAAVRGAASAIRHECGDFDRLRDRLSPPTKPEPEIPLPSGILAICEAPGRPVEVKLWRGGAMHVVPISATRAVSLARELLAQAAFSGITERKEE